MPAWRRRCRTSACRSRRSLRAGLRPSRWQRAREGSVGASRCLRFGCGGAFDSVGRWVLTQAGQLPLQLGDAAPFACEILREQLESGPELPLPGRDDGRGRQAGVGWLVGHGDQLTPCVQRALAGSSPSLTVNDRVPLGPRTPIVITRLGRCAAIAAATSSTEVMGRSATRTTMSPGRRPARAAGPSAVVPATTTPAAGSVRSSTPSHARPECTTRPRPAIWPAIDRTVLLAIAKPIPEAAPPSSGSVAASVGMPMTAPSESTSAPPLLPGLIGALVWITAGSATPPPSGTVRLVELTTPWVTLERSPSGLPIARA